MIKLAKAKYILGRAYREIARGLHSQRENKTKTIDKKQLVIDKYGVMWSKDKGIPEQISELKDEIKSLEKDFNQNFLLAEQNLDEAITSRKRLDQYSTVPALLACIQMVRLYSLKDYAKKNIKELAIHVNKHQEKIIIKYGKNYEKDISVCRSIAEKNDNFLKQTTNHSPYQNRMFTQQKNKSFKRARNEDSYNRGNSSSGN